MNIGESVRQGDVLLIKRAGLPEGYRKVEKRAVVALGESSGHEHVVEKNAEVWVDGMQVWGVSDTDIAKIDTAKPSLLRYLHILDSTSLDHSKEFKPTGDHDSIDLEPGYYEVEMQRQKPKPTVQASRVEFVGD